MGRPEPGAAKGHGGGVEFPLLGQPIAAAAPWPRQEITLAGSCAARSASVRRSSASFSIASRNSIPVNAGSRVPLPLGRIAAVSEWQGKR